MVLPDGIRARHPLRFPASVAARWPAIPARFPFVHCQSVARQPRIFLSQAFPAGPALPRPGRSRAADVRKPLSQASADARAVLRAVRACFGRVPDPVDARGFSLSGRPLMSPGAVKRFLHDVSHRSVSLRGRLGAARGFSRQNVAVPRRAQHSTARPDSCPVRSAGLCRPRDHGAPFGRCDVPGGGTAACRPTTRTPA